MLNQLKKFGLWGIVIILMMAGFAQAETERGDLSTRFEDVPRIEYNGENYSLRNQLTTVLLMGILEDEATGEAQADFVALLVIDDDERRMSPVRINADMLVSLPDSGETLPIRSLYAQGDGRDENCLRMVSAVNGLLGEELINYYAAFELKGAAQIEGYEPAEGDAEAQLRALKTVLDQKSMDELTELNKQLADYIITDMKSGSLAKVLDKSERYDQIAMVDLPTESVEGGEGEEAMVIPDEEAIFEMIVPLFYMQSIW